MEVWDLYTEGRIKTGETHLRGTALPKNRFHLVVHVWIVNAKGEYLISAARRKQALLPADVGMCRRLRVAEENQCGQRCAGGQGRGRY